MSFIHTFIRWLKHPFSSKVEATSTKKKPSTREAGKEVEEAGRWYFKSGVLEQLPAYMRDLKRMRKGDTDSYALYSRVGASIVPGGSLAATDKVEPLFKNCLPSFTAVCLSKDDEEDDGYAARFIYVRKIAPSAGIEPWDGPIYTCTVFLYSPTAKKAYRRGFLTFVVGISPDQTTTLLRELRTVSQIIPHGDGTRSTLSRKEWNYPSWINAVDGVTPDKAKEYFCCAANWYTNSEGGIRVQAKKDNISAVFNIDMLRTPYFFKDRDDVIDPETGVKKRIFHIVRTHKRKTGSFVRSHFRGLRRFSWNGYAVNITVPDLHHRSLMEFSTEAYDKDNSPEETVMLDSKDVGDRLAKVLSA